MPQIWLTYQELVEEGFASDAATARSMAIHYGMTRKKSRDGLSRVLLPNNLAKKLILEIALREFALEKQSDQMVAGLRSKLRQAAPVVPYPDVALPRALSL